MPGSGFTTTLFACGIAAAPAADLPLDLTLSLARPVELAGSGRTRNVLRVGLRGRPTASKALEPSTRARPPINIALVLDRSGSMAGPKIARARHAARMLLERLGPADIVSVITYDDIVRVLLPATRVERSDTFLDALDKLQGGGSTALFAGVSRGIAEVRRFVDPARVDRVVLLSDGQANIGPSAPSELGRLGLAAAKEGISVSTIGLGLGYNEDLMTRLALTSDGNHGFAETSDDLTRLFDAELRDALSVVAESVELHLQLGRGVHVLRSLNRSVELYGDHGVARLVQLSANQEKHFLFELELPPGEGRNPSLVAEVQVRARRTLDGRPVRFTGRAHVIHHRDPAIVKRAQNRSVLVATIEAVAVAASRAALRLRDQGRLEEARTTLRENAAFLLKHANRYGSRRLQKYSMENAANAAALDDESAWTRLRKKMRSRQHKLETQQSY